MTFLGFSWSHGAIWLAAALGLAIAELIAPGFFMIFLAAGAAITGFAVLFAPGLPVLVQALLFALFTAAAVGLGRRWYHRSAVPTEDPLLNDRAARLIGSTAEVCAAISAGEGRVKVGDGAWKARGPDAEKGAVVRIVGASGSVLLVEPA
jgi:membrane protein implicated in regulation of membrane protease activity